MAIGLLRKNYETQVCQFIVDDVTEIDLLPNINTSGMTDPFKKLYCAMGSTAKLTSDDSVFYLLTGENIWVEKSSSGSGSGSGSSCDCDNDYADEEDIDSMFPEEGGSPGEEGESNPDENVSCDCNQEYVGTDDIDSLFSKNEGYSSNSAETSTTDIENN